MSKDLHPRILVVDDEADIRNEYSRILSDPGPEKNELGTLGQKLFGVAAVPACQYIYNLTICSQGDEAVEEVRKSIETDTPFAAVFIDMRMPPGHDGLWTAKNIRLLDPAVLIVIVTAHSDYEPEAIIEEAGPGERLLYLRKPFTTQEIRCMAQSLCQRWINERKQFLIQSQLLEENQIQVKSAIQQVEKLKSDFLDTVSHEIRTPLTIFRNAISNTLHQGGQLEQRTRTNLEMADASIERLSKIISDFLDLSQLDAGTLKLNFARFQVCHVVEQVVGKFQKAVQDKRLNLRTDIEPGLSGFGDIIRLRQSLKCLIDNAVKFAPHDSYVRIIARYKDDLLEIAVSDKGPGIPQEDLPYIFDRFVQVQKLVGPGEHGTGLGLTLARRFIELHGGNLSVESAPDQGSTFVISLPLKQSAHAHALDKQGSNKVS
ncbi:MAG: hypothetical protein A2Y07_11335 [Planctomycetes bacterium GWF2_50_10]|nr:MAG: hypothetical protein A2Y07_11335 [Planctomycetes bacterium GWF2_50_10]